VSAAPWAAHFGLTRTPFGKSIPARDLFARQAHAEAIARISFCVVESALCVVTGDTGAGKTVALRAVFRAVERGHGDGVSVAGCVVRGLSGGLVLRGLVDGVTVAV